MAQKNDQQTLLNIYQINEGKQDTHKTRSPNLQNQNTTESKLSKIPFYIQLYIQNFGGLTFLNAIDIISFILHE